MNKIVEKQTNIRHSTGPVSVVPEHPAHHRERLTRLMAQHLALIDEILLSSKDLIYDQNDYVRIQVEKLRRSAVEVHKVAIQDSLTFDCDALVVAGSRTLHPFRFESDTQSPNSSSDQWVYQNQGKLSGSDTQVPTPPSDPQPPTIKVCNNSNYNNQTSPGGDKGGSGGGVHRQPPPPLTTSLSGEQLMSLLNAVTTPSIVHIPSNRDHHYRSNNTNKQEYRKRSIAAREDRHSILEHSAHEGRCQRTKHTTNLQIELPPPPPAAAMAVATVSSAQNVVLRPPLPPPSHPPSPPHALLLPPPPRTFDPMMKFSTAMEQQQQQQQQQGPYVVGGGRGGPPPFLPGNTLATVLPPLQRGSPAGLEINHHDSCTDINNIHLSPEEFDTVLAAFDTPGLEGW